MDTLKNAIAAQKIFNEYNRFKRYLGAVEGEKTLGRFKLDLMSYLMIFQICEATPPLLKEALINSVLLAAQGCIAKSDGGTSLVLQKLSWLPPRFY